MIRFLPKTTNVIVSLIIYIIIISGIVMFWFNDFLYLSVSAISLFLIILPDYWYSQSQRLKRVININLVNVIQLVIAFVCFNSLLGALTFYDHPNTLWYDTLLHLINPALIFSFTAVFVIIYQHYLLSKITKAFTLFGNFILVILGSFFWEFFEKSVDSIFVASTMFGQNGEIYFDTIYDLIADLTGGVIASILVYFFIFNYIMKNLNFSHDHK